MTLRHRFLVGTAVRGCGKVTDNPEHDAVTGNVLCAHCDTWFPRVQFEVVS